MSKSENGPFLPVKAWACVCKEKTDPHLYTFANGFGIYPDKADAEYLAQQHGNAYKVVRVLIVEDR